MSVRSGFIDAIGNTPLIRLRAASDATGCDIYGKAEFLNPGGSIKDRAALAIINDAEQRGQLKPGGIIVEGTAGNVGIGIALVANARVQTLQSGVPAQEEPAATALAEVNRCSPPRRRRVACLI